MIDPRIALLDETAPNADGEQLVRRLDTTQVIVRAVANQAAAALSLVNLIARLIPNVRVEAPDNEVTVSLFGVGSMSEVAASVARAARLATPRPVGQSILVDVGVGAPGADLYAWSDGWSLALSPSSIGAMVSTALGPAQVAVSALAAGEVLRRVLPELPGVRLAEPVVWNLVDYERSLVDPVPEAGDARAVLFGAGSVGSSFVYALLLSEARGRIDVVDPDSLQPRNKLRYPLWIERAHGRKVDWLASFSTGRLNLEPAAMTASDWIERAGEVELAVAAVDNASARRDIVDLLARTTLNAGVDGLQLHVSSHHLGDGLACVYCPYVDVSDAADQVDVYVGLTGLDASRVADLLRGARVSQSDLDAMAAAGRLKVADLELVGGRIVDITRHHLYAQAAARVGATALAVSAPYVSAMAGALLAAEVLKISAASPFTVDRRVDVDCSGYPTGFTSRPRTDPSGRCLCHNPIRQRLYRERWKDAVTHERV
jgi:hypothetical protein